MAWGDYVVRVAGDNQSEIARALGVSQSTVSRWLEGARPDSSLVLAFADYYGVDRVEALVHGANLDVEDTADLIERLGTGESDA